MNTLKKHLLLEFDPVDVERYGIDLEKILKEELIMEKIKKIYSGDKGRYVLVWEE